MDIRGDAWLAGAVREALVLARGAQPFDGTCSPELLAALTEGGPLGGEKTRLLIAACRNGPDAHFHQGVVSETAAEFETIMAWLKDSPPDYENGTDGDW